MLKERERGERKGHSDAPELLARLLRLDMDLTDAAESRREFLFEGRRKVVLFETALLSAEESVDGGRGRGLV
jgi:hypothetical protein